MAAAVSGGVDFDAEDSSDHDHEANVRALQHELDQRKQEVKRLRLEQRARQKEQLKAKELVISQQLHVCLASQTHTWLYAMYCGLRHRSRFFLLVTGLDQAMTGL